MKRCLGTRGTRRSCRSSTTEEGDYESSSSVLEERRSYRTRRQFCDIGIQYPHRDLLSHEEQKRLARGLQRRLAKTKTFKDDIVTPVVPAGEFWPAEDYTRISTVKNPVEVQVYRTGCGATPG